MKDRTSSIRRTRTTIRELWGSLSAADQARYLSRFTPRQRVELDSIVGQDGKPPQSQAESARTRGAHYQTVHTVELAIHRTLTTDPKQTPTRRALVQRWATLSQAEQEEFLRLITPRQREELLLIVDLNEAPPQTLAERVQQTGQTIAAQANLEKRLLRRLESRNKPKKESRPPVQIDRLQQLITDQNPAPEALKAIAMSFFPRQQAIALLLLDGKSVKEIMDDLNIAGSYVRTVRNQIVDVFLGIRKVRRSLPKPRSTRENIQRQPEVVVFTTNRQITKDEPKEKNETEILIDTISLSFAHAKKITSEHVTRTGQLPPLYDLLNGQNDANAFIGQLWLLGLTTVSLDNQTVSKVIQNALENNSQLAINDFPADIEIARIAEMPFTGAEIGALWMIHELGMSVNECARVFAEAPKTIRNYYSNMLTKLRAILQDNTV